MNDNAEILGIKNTEELIEILPNKINNILGLVVDIFQIFFDDKNYLKMKINKTYASISYNSNFYIKKSSNPIELNGENLTNFLLKKYAKTWDEVVEERFTLDEIDLKTIEKFKKIANDRVLDIVSEYNLKEFLLKFYLYKGKYLKRAAILFFAKNSAILC